MFQNKYLYPVLLLLALLVPALACTCDDGPEELIDDGPVSEEAPEEVAMGGFHGTVSDSDTGAKIAGAQIVFESEDGSLRRNVQSAANGDYQVDLPQGRYWVTASHGDYETYSTHPGFFVVPGSGIQTGNISLKSLSQPQESATGGFQDITSDSATGAKIGKVHLVFEREDGAVRQETLSGPSGSYRIDLPQGRYWVTASHDGYETYSTHPGFFVVTGSGIQTGNIFLDPRQDTSGGTAGCGGVDAVDYCWYFGADSASCDDVCAFHGGYHEASRYLTGSDGSPDYCRTVLNALGLPVNDFYETAQGGLGCFALQNTDGNYFGYWDEHPTTSSATYSVPGRQRICACQQ